MKLHPLDEILAQASALADRGIDCYQQFNCRECGAKNTIDEANVFYKTGKCGDCAYVTDLTVAGCNLMVTGPADVVLEALMKKELPQ